MLGAVAYAPKVVTIWEGFKDYFEKQGMPIDYLLFSNYETQVEALFNGQIDSAWNSPLAALRAERMGRSFNQPVHYGPMRDSDQNLTSVLVTQKKSAFKKPEDLRSIGFGAWDSPQARIIPLQHLSELGLFENKNFRARLFDVLVGKHGDHIGGERDSALAMLANEVDACWMLDSNYEAFSKDGTLPASETRVLARTTHFDHCIFTYAPESASGTSPEICERFSNILLGMKWSDPQVRPLLELEGLKEWRAGRTSGFSLLDKGIDLTSYYDKKGKVLAKTN